MVNFVWAKEIIKKYPEANIQIHKKGDSFVYSLEGSNVERLKRITDELDNAMPKPVKSKEEIKRLLEAEEKAIKKFNDKDLRYWEIKNRIDALKVVLNLSGGELVKYG